MLPNFKIERKVEKPEKCFYEHNLYEKSCLKYTTHARANLLQLKKQTFSAC